jgi:hypothetical protein
MRLSPYHNPRKCGPRDLARMILTIALEKNKKISRRKTEKDFFAKLMLPTQINY